MRDYAKKIPNRAKKGDDRFVTLFFVAFTATFALAVFAVTPVAVDTVDSLVRFAPAASIVYIHGSAAGATRLIDASVDVPAELRPREAAMFILANNDGSFARGTLLGWSPLRKPTKEELAALTVRGAIRVAPTTYLLGTDALATVVRSAKAEHHALGDVQIPERALSAMRGISTLQAFIDPSVLKKGPGVDLLQNLEPFVAGITPTTLLSRAIVVPASTAAAYYPFGFRIPSTTPAHGLSNTSRRAKTVVSESRPGFDPIALLFGVGKESAIEIAGGNERSALLDVLNAPVQASFFPDTEKGATSILLHYPTLSPEKIAPALERYASASRPEHLPFLTPDKDLVVELKLNVDRFHFAPLVRQTLPPNTKTISMERPALTLFLAPDGQDGRTGSLLTTDSLLLEQTSRDSQASQTICPRTPSPTSITINAPATLLASQPLLALIIPFLENENFKATLLGDNVLFLCGYHD